MIGKTPVAIPAKLADDPEFARENALLSVLTAGKAEIEATIEAAAADAYLASHPDLAKQYRKMPKRERIPAAKKELPGEIEASDTVLEAIALIRGGEVTTLRSRRHDLEEMRWGLDIIRRAICEQTEKVEAARSRASAAASIAVKAQHAEALVAVYRAAKALSVAAKAERGVRAQVLEAGFVARDDLLPPPQLAAALWLAMDGVDSPLETFRRSLVARGIWSDQ